MTFSVRIKKKANTREQKGRFPELKAVPCNISFITEFFSVSLKSIFIACREKPEGGPAFSFTLSHPGDEKINVKKGDKQSRMTTSGRTENAERRLYAERY